MLARDEQSWPQARRCHCYAVVAAVSEAVPHRASRCDSWSEKFTLVTRFGIATPLGRRGDLIENLKELSLPSACQVGDTQFHARSVKPRTLARPFFLPHFQPLSRTFSTSWPTERKNPPAGGRRVDALATRNESFRVDFPVVRDQSLRATLRAFPCRLRFEPLLQPCRPALRAR